MNLSNIFGPLWNLRDIWTYWPPGLFVKVVLFAAALVIIPSVWFRLGVKTYREAYVEAQAQKARLQTLVDEGFSAVGKLTPDAEGQAALGGTEQKPVELAIHTKPAEQQADGAIIQQAAIVYPNDVSRFSFALLSGHDVWRKGSSLLFEGESPKGVRLDEALRKDYVEKLVKESDKIVCLGLASAEPAPPGDNQLLSDHRAINLCTALHNIGYADETRQQSYGLALGEAQSPPGQAVSFPLQRSVIVVGLINSRRLPRPEDIVRSLTELVKVPGVNLGSYRRADGAQFQTYIGIRRGSYEGYNETDWTTIDGDGSNPFEDKPKPTARR
jgi:hypothetical protein